MMIKTNFLGSFLPAVAVRSFSLPGTIFFLFLYYICLCLWSIILHESPLPLLFIKSLNKYKTKKREQIQIIKPLTHRALLVLTYGPFSKKNPNRCFSCWFSLSQACFFMKPISCGIPTR